jgi:trimeric autotransporter adhesin
VSGLSIIGADAANYILVLTNLSANITAAPITVSGLSVVTKIYDGTNSATLTGTAALSPAPFLSDVVTLGGTPSASFNNKNAAAGKSVTVIGYSISGTDAGNYLLSQPAGLTGTITTVPTTCVIVSSANPSTLTSNVTFTATITANPLPVVNDAPTGFVSFSTNGIPQVSITVVSNAPGVAKATWSTAGLPLGTTTVLSAYLTDNNYGPSNHSLDQVVNNSTSASAVTINNISGTTLSYGGGSGGKFILVKSATANAPMSAWTYPGLTNTATPGSFTIPAVGTGTPVFYRVQSSE